MKQHVLLAKAHVCPISLSNQLSQREDLELRQELAN